MNLQPRKNQNYSDCLYSIQALMNVVYPYPIPATETTAEEWRRGIFDAVAIPYTDEPTIGQLWLIEEFLIEKIKEMHQQTELLMEVKHDA